MAARMMIGGGFCLVFSPWILLVVYGFLGYGVGNLLLAVVVIGLLLTIAEFVNSRRTMYYLTNTRIVETRGGMIRTEISLEAFLGVNLDDFIEIKSTYHEGASTFYQAKIRDPASGRLLIMSGLDEDARDIILKINS
jgi:hypothetical protein